MTTCPDSSPRVGAGEPTGSPSKRLTTSGGPIRPSIIIPANTTVLMAVHDYDARSPDELTLRKGEHLELLERDEEFGDGWYLGRSFVTDQKGLFPQVYTTPSSASALMQASPGVFF